MATSKKDKSRTKKTEKFKEEAKKANAIASQPRTHMVPQTEWQSGEMLDLRGDLAEGFELSMVKAYEALQQAGSIFQQFMAMNIQSGKAKVTYIWNTGAIPTDKELSDWKAGMELMQKKRETQMAELQKNLQEEANGGTVLETIGGQPLTEQNLEAERGGPGLIIQP